MNIQKSSSLLHGIFKKFPAGFPLPMVLDGATGTALMHNGMPHGACSETWILENPETLRAIQQKYIDAGSDAVLAPTFGANRQTLANHKVEISPKDINLRLSGLSKNLSEKNYLVGGDISTTGLFIEPVGDAKFDDLADIFSEQAEALENNVDFYMIETQISLAETRAAAAGVRKVSEKPIFVSFTIDKNGRTLSGDTLPAAFITLSESGISAFGANCSSGPEQLLCALKELVPFSLAFGIPLLAKPNAGLPHENADGSVSFDLNAKDFASFVPQFADNNIFILGGCCGTDSDYIGGICENIRKHMSGSEYAAAEVTKNCADSELFATLSEKKEKLISTNKKYTFVTDPMPEFICVDEDIYDTACELADDGADYLAVRLDSVESAKLYIENSVMIGLPAVITGEKEAVEYFVRHYNGKTLVI